jgi:hypothetical protein
MNIIRFIMYNKYIIINTIYYILHIEMLENGRQFEATFEVVASGLKGVLANIVNIMIL